MLTNPHTGQRVRVAVEYRDEWPVHMLGDLIGKITGIGNFVSVQFEGRPEVVTVPARFLEGVD